MIPARVVSPQMLKKSTSLLESDPRHRDQVFIDAVTRKYRPMCFQDMHDMVSPIGLNPEVPGAIREQFDIARNAFVYSWFVYEFATLAEQQCFEWHLGIGLILPHCQIRLEVQASPSYSKLQSRKGGFGKAIF
jgi:hypothetical protein